MQLKIKNNISFISVWWSIMSHATRYSKKVAHAGKHINIWTSCKLKVYSWYLDSMHMHMNGPGSA